LTTRTAKLFTALELQRHLVHSDMFWTLWSCYRHLLSYFAAAAAVVWTLWNFHPKLPALENFSWEKKESHIKTERTIRIPSFNRLWCSLAIHEHWVFVKRNYLRLSEEVFISSRCQLRSTFQTDTAKLFF
jgi:hypothetical protein